MSTTYAKHTELDQFTAGYLECAAWCSIDWPEHGEPTGCIDQRAESWSAEALESVGEDCHDFLVANLEDLEAAVDAGRPWDHLGHDFMLSRNGHGTGFWDRGLGEVGDRLHAAAKVYGETNYWCDAANVVQPG